MLRSLPLLAIIVLAAALRYGGACGELWIDEVWSLELVGRVTSPLSVLSEIRHDNNHPLNSLYLYMLGDGWPWLVYRLPAIFAGTGAVAAGAWCASSRGRAEQLVVATSMAVSYPLIHYSSEARGYSFAVLFALLAYKAVTEFAESPRFRWSSLFVVSSVLGCLSHLAFAYVYAAAAVWTAMTWYKRRHEEPGFVSRMLQLHAVPVLCLVMIYWTTVHGMELGGGPRYSTSGLLLQVASLQLSGPVSGPAAGTYALLSACLVLGGLLSLRQRGADDWKFLLLVMGAPIAYLIVAQPHFMFARYFLLAAVFGLLCCCHAVVRLWNFKHFGKPLVIVAASLFILANLTQYRQLLTFGRGEYLTALEWMANNSGPGPIRVSGDHDFGLRKLVEFYEPHVNTHRDLVYYDAHRWPAGGIDWLILHEAGDAAQRRQLKERYTVDGFEFQRVRSFATSSLSGWRWHCYARVESPELRAKS